jgi:hypothetical protein
MNPATAAPTAMANSRRGDGCRRDSCSGGGGMSGMEILPRVVPDTTIAWPDSPSHQGQCRAEDLGDRVAEAA